jgi:hypothetical protein
MTFLLWFHSFVLTVHATAYTHVCVAVDADGSILIQEVTVIYSAMRLEAIHCDMAVLQLTTYSSHTCTSCLWVTTKIKYELEHYFVTCQLSPGWEPDSSLVCLTVMLRKCDCHSWIKYWITDFFQFLYSLGTDGTTA